MELVDILLLELDGEFESIFILELDETFVLGVLVLICDELSDKKSVLAELFSIDLFAPGNYFSTGGSTEFTILAKNGINIGSLLASLST